MDDTVNNFLKEINEIVPPKQGHGENAWKECMDKHSGFPYYWNLHTDEVTWVMPEEFKNKQNKMTGLYIPPKTLPSSSVPVPTESVKIYKIEHESTKPVTVLKPTLQKKIVEPKHVAVKKTFKSTADSDDEKITLISSYGGDTDSEDEEETNICTGTSDTQNTSNENEGNVLKKPQINVLKNVQNVENKKEISGFKLVAGYSSDEEEDDKESKSELDTVKIENKPCSTLFPIQERATLEQLKVLEEKTSPLVVQSESIDTKVFQRKRKIDIDVVNAQNKPKQTKINEPNEQVGVGYKSSSYTDYLGFKSGGVMFVKNEEIPSKDKEEKSIEDVTKENKLSSVEFDETKTTLCEKLTFLSEGHSAVSPVQTMMIQVETLYAAAIHGSLNSKYFHDWLNDTCTDLIKLEQEAAPSGWLLQWDRLNKRYFYQNKSTGESQWEYPQPDVIRCDEAMDISTTPPPPPVEEDEEFRRLEQNGKPPEPPPPPKIGSCSPLPPPPPPIITPKKNKSKKLVTSKPLQEETPCSNEPLPPGVDALEVEVPVTKADNLHSALSSFYSEMATIEFTTNAVAPEVTSAQEKDLTLPESVADKIKKKKKTKVKIAQGLAMKKKGVSKLVEKWKNVQNNY